MGVPWWMRKAGVGSKAGAISKVRTEWEQALGREYNLARGTLVRESNEQYVPWRQGPPYSLKSITLGHDKQRHSTGLSARLHCFCDREAFLLFLAAHWRGIISALTFSRRATVIPQIHSLGLGHQGALGLFSCKIQARTLFGGPR
jgi:hypothetical protein